jgi:hypothetical protein
MILARIVHVDHHLETQNVVEKGVALGFNTDNVNYIVNKTCDEDSDTFLEECKICTNKL